jgi:NADH-quinone oxidoreductase subunit C
MSEKVLARLREAMGARILETSSYRGDEVALVAPEAWSTVALFLRDDPQLEMNHLIDITACDYPEREPDLPRFDVLLMVRSQKRNHRIRIKTRVREGEELESLVPVWKGADWAEREIYDMFGVKFHGHPDLRRILMYDEFVGFPLRKDYPITQTQPLIPYRDVEGTEKIAPFGLDEGQPFARVDWNERLTGRGVQVSPALATQQGQRKMLSQSDAVVPTQQQPPPMANALAHPKAEE